MKSLRTVDISGSEARRTDKETGMHVWRTDSDWTPYNRFRTETRMPTSKATGVLRTRWDRIRAAWSTWILVIKSRQDSV